jgi:saccharopine dehydrogenase (NAD+, L-lysine-forming)
VAHGIIEIMNLMDVQEVEPDEYLENTFEYPVYVHLKGKELYEHKQTGKYNRTHFHNHPQEYNCLFKNYISCTDILLNGVYWDTNIPRLFEMNDLKTSHFKIQTIADITDDENGSVPCNLGDGTIESPVYGVDKNSFAKTDAYLKNSVDIMAVGNLPNELSRDASRFFGEQLIKYVLDDVQKGGSEVLARATILKDGAITEPYLYMSDYAL